MYRDVGPLQSSSGPSVGPLQAPGFVITTRNQIGFSEIRTNTIQFQTGFSQIKIIANVNQIGFAVIQGKYSWNQSGCYFIISNDD
jgi:hypothetical protein